MNREKDKLVKTILQDIEKLKNNFSDKNNCQNFLNNFEKNINELWDFVSEDDFSKNLVIVLADCAKNINADNLKIDQLDIIKNSIEAISIGNITEQELDNHMDNLIKKDIPLILLPKNISEMYE